MTEFAGRVALVTGAGRGIGQAAAVELARGGAIVVLVARSTDQLKQTASLIDDVGGVSHTIPTDLGDERQVHALLRRLGDIAPVDILINNAAVVWPLGPSTEVDISQWAAALQINVVAVAQLTFALLPGMLGRGWGRIVNVSSGIAVNPGGMPGGNAYATAKAAIEAHTLNLAAELAGTGVTVNAYRPGTVDTAMQEWIRAQSPGEIGAPLHDRFVTMYRSGVLITPQASAHALVSRLGSAATGRIWDVSDPV